MSLAGPGANFALMIVAVGGIRAGIALGHFRQPESASFTRVVDAVHPESLGFLATFLSILFVLNLLLGTFNLIPVPPLDGNTGITLLLPEKAARRFKDISRTSGYALIGLMAAWVIYGRVFPHLFRTALGVLYPGTSWG